MRVAILSLAFLFLTSSCASIFSKSTYAVNIDSTPQGASFKILDRAGMQVSQGNTPQIVLLKSSAGYFTKEEYQVIYSTNAGKEVILPITFHVDGWYIVGNFFIGGLIGYLLIDPLTGAMYTIDQKVVHANLGGSSSNEGPSLKIMTIDEYQGSLDDLIPIEN